MKKTICTFLTTLLLLSSIFAQGQRCSECDIALNRNATDVFESRTSMKYDEATSELFNHDYTFWSTYQNSSNHTTSLDASYSIYSASYGNSSGSTEAQQKFESMRTNYSKNHTLSQNEQEYISSKVASKDAYAAWTACILACIPSGGVFLEKAGNNDDEFIVTLKNIPAGGPGTETKVTDIQTTNILTINGAINSGDLQKGNKLAPWNTLQGVFKRADRNIDASISVTVSNFKSPDPIIIPKYTESNKLNLSPPPPSMPVGTVVAFAGNQLPPGWLLCDGSVVNESKYQALSYAIGTFWGNGDHSRGSFNLPDMRGMFLRGVDGGANNDPDSTLRTSTNGGNSRGIGSKQPDQLKSHTHKVASVNALGEIPKGNWDCIQNSQGLNFDEKLVQSTGGLETRPKNVYVYYIIKH